MLFREASMRPKKIIIAFISLAAAIILSACVSANTDVFIAKNMSSKEKSRIIFEKGLDLYNSKLMENNDLQAIPEVRGYFEAAVQADPENLKAQEYLSKTDAFKAHRFESYLKNAKRLRDKKGRTDGESFELVLSTQRASDLDAVNGELIKLKIDTAEIRKMVIQKRVDSLETLEKKLKASKAPSEVAKLVPQTNKIISEVQLIDPGNRDAAGVKRSMDDVVLGFAKKDLEDTRNFMTVKKYANAETCLLRAEKTLSNVTKEKNPEVVSLKYQLYFKWAQEFYAQKQYISADNRVNIAISANKTAEALDLKNRISRAVAAKSQAGRLAKAGPKVLKPGSPLETKDYDAEIDGVLESVDATIARDDLRGAMDLIDFNIEMMKVQANVDKLQAKKAIIIDKLKSIYSDSVASYNEEDYETARDGFRSVIRIDPDYEQAQAYLEKANNKIRALEGN
jgi:tetratricopeptide (TPR) repeat protein